MKSPKFQFLLEEIQQSISVNHLEWAWKHKLGAQLRKQIIFDLVEYKDFTNSINYISTELMREIDSAQYRPSKPIHYLVEKSRGLCRQMTLSHPRDMLVLQSLSSALYSDIKNSMPTDSAFFEPGDQKFEKKKLLQSGGEYGAFASWMRFQQSIFEFSKERNYVVVTDVANFYDFINFDHLRNIVASICDVKEAVLDFLVFILNEISWNPDFMPRSGIGLPQMDIEAPRVLANAMLFELDKVADKHSLGDYVRFMDDIDVGVDSIVQAKKVVRDIDLTLQSRQLRLNSSKTKILNSRNGEVARHFCIKENYLLDKSASKLQENNLSVNGRALEERKLRRLYRVWRGESISKSPRFFDGNGEKIFKRLAKLMLETSQQIPQADLIWLIKNRPSLRSFCFSLLARVSPANLALYELENILTEGMFIDDLAIVDLTRFLLHAKFKKTQKFEQSVSKISQILLLNHGYFGLYCNLLLASKFYKQPDILKLLNNTQDRWKTDFWLGRTVGGLMPIMSLQNESRLKYLQLIQKSENPSANAVYSFHDSIQSDRKFAENLTQYAKSPNPSFPQKIFHPKALIILSVLQNEKLQNQRKTILSAHPILTSDSYYKTWFIR